jgi:hypothetical protein
MFPLSQLCYNPMGAWAQPQNFLAPSALPIPVPLVPITKAKNITVVDGNSVYS